MGCSEISPSIYCNIGVSALGGKITYIKRKVDYPTHSGAWKTDPKFIGVR